MKDFTNSVHSNSFRNPVSKKSILRVMRMYFGEIIHWKQLSCHLAWALIKVSVYGITT